MNSGIEVISDYGGLTVRCDQRAFTRLCELIGAEAAIADLSSDSAAMPVIDFIRVVRASFDDEPAAHRPGWGSLVLALIAACLSGVVYVTGLVAIILWMMR